MFICISGIGRWPRVLPGRSACPEFERRCCTLDRSLWPADPVSLPGRQDHLEDPFLRQTRIVARLWIDDANRPGDVAPGTEDSDRVDPATHRASHWFWLGAHQSDGRAVIRMNGKVRPVTRVLWTMYRRAADTRKVLRRTGDERGCVNPWHHESVLRGSWQRSVAVPRPVVLLSPSPVAVSPPAGYAFRRTRLGAQPNPFED
jgi:hypothetical protein